MYPGPASGVTPPFGPCPPSGQLSGATTGEPLIPSPTSGSRPALIRPIFAGQPGRIAAEVHCAPEHVKPLLAADPGSEERLHMLWGAVHLRDRKSTRLNSSHQIISYAVFCLKKKTIGIIYIGIYITDL